MKVIRDLFTGIDGKTWDLGRWLWAAGALILLAGGVMSVIRGPLNFVEFAAAFGGLLMAGGGALLFKKSTEPQQVVATQETLHGTATQTVTTGASKTEEES